MRRRRAFFVSFLSIFLLSVGVAPPALASDGSNDVAHAVSGCGGELTVHTPANPDKPLSFGASRPSPPQEQRLFQEAAQRHVRWVPTFACKPVTHKHAPLPASHTNATINSDNWSGYQVNVSSPDYAQASWVVPLTFSTTVTGYSSIWPGIGGGFNGGPGELIQDGTEQDSYCDSGGCGAPTFFWFEVYPDEPEQEVTNISVFGDDSVEATVSWSGGQAEFTLCDWTSGVCGTGSQNAAAPSNTAEWIVERPTVGGSLPPLADFGSASLSAGEYGTSNTSAISTIGEGGPESINMYNGADQLDSTGPLDSSGSAFTTTWLRSS